MSKFCYEKGELQVASSQCELCKYYNNGERSDVCPMDQIEDITKNVYKCPKFHMPSILDELENET
ncbi:MAG: hypothetical protein K5871_08910 [Lachnospiraceae bacterium]|nr:hypothetical protein [Lachnospiraceae bacterium]